jgi:hypothetical protein
MMAHAVCSLQGKVGFVIDFFNGGLGAFHHCPCLDVRGCRIGIVFVIVPVVIPVAATAVTVVIAA